MIKVNVLKRKLQAQSNRPFFKKEKKSFTALFASLKHDHDHTFSFKTLTEHSRIC